MNLNMNSNKKSSPVVIDSISWIFTIIFIGVMVLYTNDSPFVTVNHFRISFFLAILFGLLISTLPRKKIQETSYSLC